MSCAEMPEARRGVAIDHQRGLQALVLLVGIQVDDLRQRPQFVRDHAAPSD